MPSLRVKLTKSPIGYPKSQKDALMALGLTKMQRERELPDNPSTRGQIRKVAHLITVSEVKK